MPAEGVVNLKTLSNNKGAPKWTMQGRRGQNNSRLGTPGPGAYGNAEVNPAAKYRSPSYGFGTGTRRGPRSDTGPGPGSYGGQGRPSSAPRSCGFGSSASKQGWTSSSTPGPGAYQPSSSATRPQSPAYSYGGRSQYGYTVGRFGSTPGPGAYEPSVQLDANAPAWQFGSADRYRRALHGNPGPGSYDPPKSTVADGPQYTIRSRPQSAGNAYGGSRDFASGHVHMVDYTQFD